MAFDPVQKILAVGTQSGALRLFGRPGVECYCQHESGAAVIQMQFLINEGALVSALADDSVHLWNLRQKRPAILHSLKFSRESVPSLSLDLSEFDRPHFGSLLWRLKLFTRAFCCTPFPTTSPCARVSAGISVWYMQTDGLSRRGGGGREVGREGARERKRLSTESGRGRHE
ncbi:hypothetical protein CRUP_015780 [Coryphaenoides rupestris]|nr:hypothetical protein CRUP_015780 [Coryphaenoides rupestris]